eukprot:gb/GFBE01054213.1/.p1 GENE.gb/GFBE01054213.1/~~gb/GFBE01054213.1/.p1  ORF type:complete len:700 (+),score=174.08 gb/GFBE01054213.1/:1-2100(+)
MAEQTGVAVARPRAGSRFVVDEAEEAFEAQQAEANKNSFIKKCMTSLCNPSMAVYIPKSVNVANTRISCIYFLLEIVVLACCIYYVSDNDRYSIFVEPDIMVSLCSKRCELLPGVMDKVTDKGLARTYCSANPSYAASTATYSNFECLQRCGRLATASACVRPQELVQVDGEAAFIPTSMREAFATQKVGLSCPSGFSTSGSQCRRTKDYFVAGVEDVKLTFNHQFSVLPHVNSMNLGSQPSALKAHTGSFHAQGWDDGMLTVLLSHTGSELRRFKQGTAIELTVKDLLEAAHYHGIADGAFSLDGLYKDADVGVDVDMPARLTGVAVTVDIWTTGEGFCEVHSSVQSEKTLKVTVDHPGPLTCLTVQAHRRWVTQTSEEPVGVSGAVRTRSTNGIQVKFRKMGLFQFLDEQALIKNLTVFFLWIQLPMLITYWFCMLLLGKLSGIYSCLMHQEVNVAEACKGFALRLLVYSSAFMDLRGKLGENDGPDGITKRCVSERFSRMTEGLDVEPSVLSNVIDIFFDSLKTYKKENAPNSEVVTCQEFCAACASNEALQLGTVVKIFDKDRKLGCLESLFLDNALAKVRKAAEMESEHVEAAFDALNTGEMDPDAAHSLVVQAYRDVQFMLKDLGRIEQLALDTAKDLDVNPSTLGLVGKSTTGGPAGVPTGTVLPKLKQSVSSDSIGDEGADKKRDFRDIER